ncbi:MAG: hypothetical protein HXX12_14150 [Geothrix sp.]|uniref:hypothetical protein n=1 Tax=Geothrix sp. TaxID=1962974 RepID=UPI0017EAB334|nr:hypothetical protein [Geothrix sp.]NWJ42101.1 hypothetical protein [Geothrix sp.]WIL19931.1 MAG: hypothetical protein QOZ81_002470 [Geothrix sp.]
MACHDPARVVHAVTDGEITKVGWQNQKAHRGKKAGAWYRVVVSGKEKPTLDGHMTPGSNPPKGTVVHVGDVLGTMASPTNGHATGMHDHHMEWDSKGKLIKPSGDSPLTNGVRSCIYGETGPSHPKPHCGDDWVIKK